LGFFGLKLVGLDRFALGGRLCDLTAPNFLGKLKGCTVGAFKQFPWRDFRLCVDTLLALCTHSLLLLLKRILNSRELYLTNPYRNSLDISH
jgi:hypothetical protein